MKLNPLKVTQFVLEKQHLLEGSKAFNVVQAVRDVVGLHAASVTTPYLSLFTRVKGFKREHLDQELYQNKSLVRIECVRSTLFIVPIEAVPMMYQIYKGGLATGILKDWRISLQEYEKVSRLILERLKGRTLTISQIKRLLPAESQRTLSRRSGKNIVRISNIKLILGRMLAQGILIGMPQPGRWKNGGLNYYVCFLDWFPDLNLNDIDREEARTRLVKLYLRSYGPVTKKDIRWWSGFRMKEVKCLLANLEDEVLEVEISGLESVFIMLKSDFMMLQRFEPIRSHSISLLPYEDSYVKGYMEREGLIPKEMRDNVYLHGEAQPTILVDGGIVGTWRFEEQQDKTTLILTFLKRIEESILRRVRFEARAVGRFVCERNVQLTEKSDV